MIKIKLQTVQTQNKKSAKNFNFTFYEKTFINAFYFFSFFFFFRI